MSCSPCVGRPLSCPLPEEYSHHGHGIEFYGVYRAPLPSRIKQSTSPLSHEQSLDVQQPTCPQATAKVQEVVEPLLSSKQQGATGFESVKEREKMLEFLLAHPDAPWASDY